MVNRQVCIFLAAVVLASMCLTPLTVRADSITPIALADPPGFFELKPIGVPMGEGVMTIDVTFFVDGKKVSGQVTIDKGKIVPFVAPKQMPGENIRDFAQRIADAKGEASQAKSKVMADAIYAQFKDQFDKLGDKPGAGLTPKTQTIKVGNQNVPNVQSFYGALTIPGINKEQTVQGAPNRPLIFKVNELAKLGEGGNGGQFIPGVGPSPGSRGSLERSTPGVESVATGKDSEGEPSVVQFGIEGLYVAEYTPATSMTDDEILSLLAGMLNTNGLPATYDPIQIALSLDNPIPDGATLIWGNTDEGLEFATEFDAVASEPAPLELLGISLVIIVLVLRRRRPTK
jgi:hypothetical protein